MVLDDEVRSLRLSDNVKIFSSFKGLSKRAWDFDVLTLLEVVLTWIEVVSKGNPGKVRWMAWGSKYQEFPSQDSRFRPAKSSWPSPKPSPAALALLHLPSRTRHDNPRLVCGPAMPLASGTSGLWA